VSFAPYFTTVAAASVKVRSSSATLIQLESSLLSVAASLLAGSAAGAAVVEEAVAGNASEPCAAANPPELLPPPPHPASAPAATKSRSALLSMTFKQIPPKLVKFGFVRVIRATSNRSCTSFPMCIQAPQAVLLRLFLLTLSTRIPYVEEAPSVNLA
jgi:hypothetical protein